MLYCDHSHLSILIKMAEDLASTTLSVPDDHHDEVKLLPEHQHPFDECEVDRRVQSVFFHHDIRKGIALKVSCLSSVYPPSALSVSASILPFLFYPFLSSLTGLGLLLLS